VSTGHIYVRVDMRIVMSFLSFTFNIFHAVIELEWRPVFDTRGWPRLSCSHGPVGKHSLFLLKIQCFWH